MTDIEGNLLKVRVHAANISDTVAGCEVFFEAMWKYPSIEAAPLTVGQYADEGYRGTFVDYLAGKGVRVDISERIKPVFEIWEKVWDGASHDYIDAISEYTKKVQDNIDCVTSERSLRQRINGVEPVTLTAADCLPDGLNGNLEGRLIIIKAEVLSPEYATSDYQLRIAVGGFGCAPNARGNAVYCRDLYTGKESRFERYDVLGVADAEKLPEWAKQKLDGNQKSKEPSNKSNEKTTIKSNKKPTLAEQLEEGKRKAARENGKKDVFVSKTKKRTGKEVE